MAPKAKSGTGLPRLPRVSLDQLRRGKYPKGWPGWPKPMVNEKVPDHVRQNPDGYVRFEMITDINGSWTREIEYRRRDDNANASTSSSAPRTEPGSPPSHPEAGAEGPPVAGPSSAPSDPTWQPSRAEVLASMRQSRQRAVGGDKGQPKNNGVKDGGDARPSIPAPPKVKALGDGDKNDEIEKPQLSVGEEVGLYILRKLRRKLRAKRKRPASSSADTRFEGTTRKAANGDLFIAGPAVSNPVEPSASSSAVAKGKAATSGRDIVLGKRKAPAVDGSSSNESIADGKRRKIQGGAS